MKGAPLPRAVRRKLARTTSIVIRGAGRGQTIIFFSKCLNVRRFVNAAGISLAHGSAGPDTCTVRRATCCSAGL